MLAALNRFQLVQKNISQACFKPLTTTIKTEPTKNELPKEVAQSEIKNSICLVPWVQGKCTLVFYLLLQKLYFFKSPENLVTNYEKLEQIGIPEKWHLTKLLFAYKNCSTSYTAPCI